MNIGGAASASRVSAKIFHHYEAASLIAGHPYRKRLSCLHPADVVMLQFIRRAREPGFLDRTHPPACRSWAE